MAQMVTGGQHEVAQALKEVAQSMASLREIRCNNGAEGLDISYNLLGGDNNHHIEASNSSNQVPPLVKPISSRPLMPKFVEEHMESQRKKEKIFLENIRKYGAMGEDI